eukprot:gnl/Trimastix_PCT/3309.p1 GENE.gnl/Trimastix_PCT/3309~~gnl/Trimastix_PCT/3309.p1  ORF type:complete len:962 (-),score=269.62 gnl/Trimastix_PCT/3309:106-2991(-)
MQQALLLLEESLADGTTSPNWVEKRHEWLSTIQLCDSVPEFIQALQILERSISEGSFLQEWYSISRDPWHDRLKSSQRFAEIADLLFELSEALVPSAIQEDAQSHVMLALFDITDDCVAFRVSLRLLELHLFRSTFHPEWPRARPAWLHRLCFARTFADLQRLAVILVRWLTPSALEGEGQAADALEGAADIDALCLRLLDLDALLSEALFSPFWAPERRSAWREVLALAGLTDEEEYALAAESLGGDRNTQDLDAAESDEEEDDGPEAGDGLFIDAAFYGDSALNNPESTTTLRSADRVSDWKRPSELSDDARLFVEGVRPGDVAQGALGDCWFLGALSVVATHPRLLRRLILDAPQEGMARFRFFKDSKWHIVTIDDRLPVDEYGRLVFARAQGSEYWVPLIEKAYAKLYGAYQALEGGFLRSALTDLTGGVPSRVKVAPSMAYEDTLWDETLSHAGEDAEYLMGCTCQGAVEAESPSGLLTGHAYGILRTATLDDGTRLIQIRNPWGCKEWKGDYCDKDSRWTPELCEALDFQPGDDGAFWMTYPDFCAHWDTIDVIRLPPAGSYRLALQGAWAPSDGPVGKLNPQYLLRLPARTRMTLSLAQTDPRTVGDGKRGFLALGLHVFHSEGDEGHRLDVERAEPVLKTAAFAPIREISIEGELDAGAYHIVPSTYARGKEGRFSLRLFGAGAFNLSALPLDQESLSLRARWRPETAGGCAAHASWITNPQFSLRAEGAPVEAYVFLTQLQARPRHSIGVSVLAGCPSGRRQLAWDPVATSGAFTNLQSVFARVTLEPGRAYAVVPTTFHPGKQGFFEVRVFYRSTDCASCTLERAVEWPCDTCAEGVWEGDTAGGCGKDRDAWERNPRFILELRERGAALVLGQQRTKERHAVGMHLLADERVVNQTASWSPSAVQSLILPDLEPGRYVLVPSTYETGCEASFTLHAYSADHTLSAEQDTE